MDPKLTLWVIAQQKSEVDMAIDQAEVTCLRGCSPLLLPEHERSSRGRRACQRASERPGRRLQPPHPPRPLPLPNTQSLSS